MSMDTYKVEQRNKRKFLFKYLFIKKGKKEKEKEIKFEIFTILLENNNRMGH